MSTILCIETTGPTAVVALSQNGQLLASRQHQQQQDHVAFLQPAIHHLMQETGLVLPQLDAVAVSNGPGSYTGLRVGLSSAKGLCFALNKPLITLSTLHIMAKAMQPLAAADAGDAPFLLCPMIDARRMEVFTALYLQSLEALLPPAAMVLTPDFLMDFLSVQRIYFSGSGAEKWLQLVQHPRALGLTKTDEVAAMCQQAQAYFDKMAFADIAYSEPFYCKEFYMPKK